MPFIDVGGVRKRSLEASKPRRQVWRTWWGDFTGLDIRDWPAFRKANANLMYVMMH
jgi:hypothetical protein